LQPYLFSDVLVPSIPDRQSQVPPYIFSCWSKSCFTIYCTSLWYKS